MSDVYSIGPGVTLDGSAGSASSINDSRRIFNFGERVAELAPQQSPFLTYLSKVSNKPTDDPVFKFLEQRHQYQRRNFEVKTAITSGAYASAIGDFDFAAGDNFDVDVLYDQYGREVTAAVAPNFLLANQIVAIECDYDADGTDAGVGSETAAVAYFKIGAAPAAVTDAKRLTLSAIKVVYKPTGSNGLTATNAGEISLAASSTLIFRENAKGQVIGSAFAEGSKDPESWRDEFWTREGYTQIFKTSVPLFSGTALATRYRGVSNEYMRVYQEKLMEHKMDIENALLFGYGVTDESSTDAARKTWGILPYTEIYGRVKTFTYASSGYDDFVDAMSDIFDAESGAGGSKMVLASRSIMNWLNKLGGNSFLGNTMASGVGTSQGAGTAGQGVTSSSYGVSIDKGQSLFNGVNVTQVDTLYGTLNFVMEPLLRGPWANHAIVVDLNNVAYRPLAGNGESRDTQIITNIQNNDVDGRRDMILTEAGLEIQLPETHAILKFS